MHSPTPHWTSMYIIWWVFGSSNKCDIWKTMRDMRLCGHGYGTLPLYHTLYLYSKVACSGRRLSIVECQLPMTVASGMSNKLICATRNVKTNYDIAARQLSLAKTLRLFWPWWMAGGLGWLGWFGWVDWWFEGRQNILMTCQN